MRRPLSLGAAAAMVVACNVLTGVGDLSIESDTSDAAAPETSTSSLPAPAAGADGGRDAAPEDAGQLGNVDAAVVDDCSTASCETLPVGFSLVALGAQGAACPTGFGQPLERVESPTLQPGACTCGCDLKQSPSCAAGGGNLALTYGPAGSGACTVVGPEVPVGCSTAGYQGPFIAYDRSYTPPASTLAGGACEAKTNTDQTKLKSTTVRLCQATVIPQCEGKTCAPALTGFDTCIAAAGDVACPGDWSNKHLVGTSASFTCAAGCSCTVAGNCGTTGTLKYFASADCTGAPGLSYPVGGCQSTPGSATAFGSHRYDPNPPTNAQCQAGGTATPNGPTLAEPTTVCCR